MTCRSTNYEVSGVGIMRCVMYRSLGNPRAPSLCYCLSFFRHHTRESCTKNLARSHRPPKSHQGLNISHQVQPGHKELKRSLSSIIQAVFQSLIFTQMTIIVMSIGWHLTNGENKIIDNRIPYTLRSI